MYLVVFEKKGHGSMTCQSHKTKLIRGWVSSPSQGLCSHIHLLLSFQFRSSVSKKPWDCSGFNHKNKKCCWKVWLKLSSLVSIWVGRAQGSESVPQLFARWPETLWAFTALLLGAPEDPSSMGGRFSLPQKWFNITWYMWSISNTICKPQANPWSPSHVFCPQSFLHCS